MGRYGPRRPRRPRRLFRQSGHADFKLSPSSKYLAASRGQARGLDITYPRGFLGGDWPCANPPLPIDLHHVKTPALDYLLDWNYDEDRSRISAGFGPENISRLRRFAVGVLKSFQKPRQSIAAMIRKLCFRTRLVFDYLRMTENSRRDPRARAA